MNFKKIVHRELAKRLAKDHKHFKLELRHKDGSGSCVVDGFNNNQFDCRFFDGCSWIIESEISVDDIDNYELIATFEFYPNYFYTPLETRNLINIFVLYITKYPYYGNKLCKIFCEKFYFLHLNKHASAVQRNKLLEFLVDKCAVSGKNSFNTENIYNEFYKKHEKNNDIYKNIYLLYIDSLRDNEDIEINNNKIVLLGKSINSIDKFKSQKTYKRISTITQILMAVATIAIAYYTYKKC